MKKKKNKKKEKKRKRKEIEKKKKMIIKPRKFNTQHILKQKHKKQIR